jgi:UDP-glucose 4-epimerase
MNVLVTGGAGYVGSAVVERVIARGHRAVVYDNLSRGECEAVAPEVAVVRGDLMDQPRLLGALTEHQIEAVMHCAVRGGVGESAAAPHRFYVACVSAGLMLLDALLTAGIKLLVFTSTAAVYGEVEKMPISEGAPHSPINPYGETMLAFERALKWYGQAYGLRSAALRCFNVAGAADGRHGAAHGGDAHLIPAVLGVAAGREESLKVFGENYATPDGTCVRDYVHVSDVAEAHALALDALGAGGGVNRTYNVGYGSGYSVAEVVEMARQVTGRRIPTEAAPRRAGDVAVAIAAPDKITRELGWQPRRSELDQIIESAWQWHLEGVRGQA